MKKLKKALFTIRWNWKNKNWNNTRQKRKSFEKDLSKFMKSTRI